MLERLAQTDFSAGMFRGVDPAEIPPNGALDITGVVRNDGTVVARGGGALLSTGAVEGAFGFWSGKLVNGVRTVVFTGSNVLRLNDDGTTTVLSAGVPAKARPAAYNGVLYWDGGTYDGTTVAATLHSGHYATIAGRLICAYDDPTGIIVSFTGFGTTTFGGTDFHKLPGGLTLKGLYPLRDSLAVFTSGGIFVISGLDKELTDAAGNVQQRIDLYSDDVVLGGAGSWGIEGYGSGIVVPAVDGVWTVSLGITSEAPLPLQKISTAIEDLWNASGPAGQAAVWRGHYLVPRQAPSEDPFVGLEGQVLVCRLDSRRYPWVRLEGYSAQASAIHVRDDPLTPGTPQILRAAYPNGRRLAVFDPWTPALDSNDSVPQLQVVTRDMVTGGLTRNQVSKVRVGYSLPSGSLSADASVTAATANVVPVGTPWTPLVGLGLGSDQEVFRFPKKGRFVRVRVKMLGLGAVLRSIEVLTRASGKQ